MKKTFKKIAASVMAAATLVSMATVTAFAANKDYSFSVTTSQNSGAAFSAGNKKDDNEQTAYVYTTSGNIVNNDIFYMAVYSYPKYDSTYRATSWKRITSNNGRYLIDYTTYRKQGSTNYLCGDTDKYTVSVEGNWYS